MNGSDLLTDLAAVWANSLQLKAGPLALSHFTRRLFGLLKQRIYAPRTLCKPCKPAWKKVRRALRQLDSLDSKTVKDLETFILSTFPGEHALKEISASRLCSSIFNVP